MDLQSCYWFLSRWLNPLTSSSSSLVVYSHKQSFSIAVILALDPSSVSCFRMYIHDAINWLNYLWLTECGQLSEWLWLTCLTCFRECLSSCWIWSCQRHWKMESIWFGLAPTASRGDFGSVCLESGQYFAMDWGRCSRTLKGLRTRSPFWRERVWVGLILCLQADLLVGKMLTSLAAPLLDFIMIIQ